MINGIHNRGWTSNTIVPVERMPLRKGEGEWWDSCNDHSSCSFFIPKRHNITAVAADNADVSVKAWLREALVRAISSS